MENLHFPGDAHPADLETTLEETSPLKTGFSHPTREEIRKIQKKKKNPNCSPTLVEDSRYQKLSVKKNS